MVRINTNTFFTQEAGPLLDSIRGPVDSFVVLDEKELLEQAIQSGEIAPGSFRNCAVFADTDSSLAEKKLRYEGQRAIGILEMLHENTEMSLDDRGAMLFAEKTMHEAVLVEAARKLNTELPGGNSEIYERALDEAQQELYSRPDIRIATYASNLVLQHAKNVDTIQADALLQRYPFLRSETEASFEGMSELKRQEWHDYLHEKYDPVFLSTQGRLAGEGLDINNTNLVRMTEIFMDVLGIPLEQLDGTEGWKVVDRPDISGFKVEPKIREVHCGSRKTEITWDNFERLMLHEIGVHVTRAENGYRAGSRVLQSGLPGNNESEEGLAILIESLWSGKELDAVNRDHFRYLTIAYADGTLDGSNGHTETEVLAFVSDLIAAQTPDNLNTTSGIAAARKQGFDPVKRAFRGMPEGKIMNSNLSYLSGKLVMMGYLEHADASPAEVLSFLQKGKFNPTIEEHLPFVA